MNKIMFKYQDLIKKIIIVLSLEYLMFFSAEVILPGVITSVFNINILLLVVLLLTSWLILFSSPGKKNIKNKTKNKNESKINKDSYTKKIFVINNNKWFLLLSASLLFVNVIALYKVSILMIAIYSIIVIIVTKLLWRNL